MERVQGIGGIFFKARDPKALSAWYQTNLGFPLESWGGAIFRSEDPKAQTLWSPFPADTDYFGAGPASFMLNFRVANLERMLAQLRGAGAQVDEKVMEEENGRFGWATDPEGNRFELWEPKPEPAPR